MRLVAAAGQETENLLNGEINPVTPCVNAHGVSIQETHDPGKARALMCTRYRKHHMRHIGGRSGFAFNHICATVPEGSFNILRYGSAVEIKPEPFQDFFMLELPISAGVDIEPEKGASFRSSTEQALLISPQLRFASTWRRDCVQLMLKIDAVQLHQRWQSLVGDQLASLPELPPQIDLQTPEGWRVRQMMNLLQLEMQRSADEHMNILATSTLGGATIDSVLSYMMQHHGTALPDTTLHVFPATFKRCTEFIKLNLDSNLSIPVLLSVSGTSERTLFNLFRQFVDKTPKAYIRSERLKQCRALLLEGRHSVTDAARLCGFTHMGRFASQYKTQYGELPSSTLKH